MVGSGSGSRTVERHQNRNDRHKNNADLFKMVSKQRKPLQQKIRLWLVKLIFFGSKCWKWVFSKRDVPIQVSINIIQILILGICITFMINHFQIKPNTKDVEQEEPMQAFEMCYKYLSSALLLCCSLPDIHNKKLGSGRDPGHRSGPGFLGSDWLFPATNM